MTTSSLLRAMLRMGKKPTVAVQTLTLPNTITLKASACIAQLAEMIKRSAEKIALLGLVATTALVTNGCGGGGVGASTAPIVGGSVLMLPATAELYEGQPVTFTISGGRPPYLVTSSNSSVVPIPSGTSGNTVTVIPRSVSAETPVVLTVRDADNLIASSLLNVRQFVLINELEFTPQVFSPGTGCGSSVCSGGDAIVRARAGGGAGVLRDNRNIRFEVISGDFDFVTPGTNVLVNALTTSSDLQGNALARLKARVNAPNQSALMQVTDLATNNVRKFAFTISQVTDGIGSITVNPTTFAWTAFYKGECVVGGVTNHYIYGGTPPYTVRSGTPDFATFAPSVVTTNGGAVTVSTTGFVCSSTGSNFIVTDAVGRTVNFTVANNIGTNDRPGLPPPPLPAPTVSPAILGPLACGISAGAIVTQSGGTATTFNVASTEPSRVSAVLASNVLTVTRIPNSPGGADTVFILVTNGTQTASIPVSVNPNNCLSGSGAGSNPILLSAGGAATATNSVSVAVGESAPIRVTGGRSPFGIISASPNIVQVSANGQNFATTTAQILVSSDFVVKGVVPGVTFVTVLDSTNPQQSTVLAVTVTGAPTTGGAALTSAPATIAITGATTSSGSVSGGTAPYLISSAGPSIAQISLDGVNFVNSTAGQFSQTGQYIVRGVTNGTTFVNVTDSSSPPRTVAIPVAVSGVGAVSNPIVATPATLTLNGVSTTPVQITGGTGPFTVSSVGPSIAQVSADGVTFQATSVGVSSNGAFVVRGVINGTTFINIVDSSNPAKQTTISVTVSGAGNVGTPIVATPNLLAVTAASSSAIAISGGTAPYLVASVGPTIAQVSANGVTFTNSTAPTSVNNLFVVRGQDNGTTFVTITDSSVPPRTTAVPITVTGAVGGAVTPITFSSNGGAATSVIVAGGSTVPVFISGGTGPNYTVASLAPSIAQISTNGVNFETSTSSLTAAGQFIVRGISTGTTFLLVSDGGSPVRSAILAITVSSTGPVVTPITLSTSNSISVAGAGTTPVTITGGVGPYTITSTATAITAVSATGSPGTFGGTATVGPGAPSNQFVVLGVSPGTAFVLITDSSGSPVTTVLVVTVTGGGASALQLTPNILTLNSATPTRVVTAAAASIPPYNITGAPVGLNVTQVGTAISINKGAAALGSYLITVTDSASPPVSGNITVTVAP